MNFIVITIGIIALAASILIYRSSKPQDDTHTVSIDDISRIYEQLRSTGSHGSFAVLTPAQADPRTGDHLNVQFSIDSGRIGLDWVLLGKVNNLDKNRVEDFAKEKSFTFVEREMNGVRFLRTEEQNAQELCAEILTEMYGMDSGEQIELIVEAFNWGK
jgi:topoisomerase IA-like protein